MVESPGNLNHEKFVALHSMFFIYKQFTLERYLMEKF